MNWSGDEMNLLQIRTKFRTLSGRFDLVNADFTDNGADFMLNEGRKFLDMLDETSKSWASAYRFVEVGGFSAQFQYCRAIKEVWAASTTVRWQLEKESFQDLTALYLEDMPGQRNTGSPGFYSPAITRYIPEGVAVDTFEAYIGWVDVPIGSAHEYNSILLSVPSDVKLLIEVRGLFYSAELVEEADENYWSVVHPSLLIMAAQRQCEIFNRNTQGVNDWTNAIATTMKQLGMDLVEELIAEVSQMGG